MGKKKRILKSGCLALAAVAAGFMFSSSAHAFIAAEAHACNADSDTGGWLGAGNFYFAGARSARTYMYEYTPVPMSLQVTLWAYPQGGTEYTYYNQVVTVDANWFYGEADAVHGEPETARGSLLSMHYAWTPTMMRGSTGFWISETEPVDANGCANRLSYL